MNGFRGEILGTLKTIAAGIGISFLTLCVGCGVVAIPIAAPSISQVLPQTVAAGSKGLTMKVVGANFSKQAVILWNGKSLPTSVVDSDTLTTTVQSSSIASPAVVQLKVQNMQTGAESNTAKLMVTSNGSNSPSEPAAPTLAISTSSLPVGTAGTSYSAGLTATGGTPAYTWSVTSGQLPGGLSLGASSGMISGTPRASGTFSFSVTVSDAGSPAQVASETVSITVGATSPATAGLTITSSSLPSGSDGTAYSAALQASGGTPAYTWSISAGSLPAGLTLAATTGVISGTPTASGTSNFTAVVSDNSNPSATQSVATSITVGAAAQPTGPGTTWYIRKDGGTRYSANMPNGQCDGKGDAAYPGTGTNQHCAFNDYRFLWDDQSYGNHAWVIAGGDTVIIRGGPWRVGWNQGLNSNDVWCNGGDGNFACTNPTIPAGTPAQHTRILGENYASCSNGNVTDRSKLTQIFGGYGVYAALSLYGAQYVDVECLDITRHSQCIVHGVPVYPSGCHSNFPIDDFDSEGIVTDVNTHDVLMQDLWVHGHTDRGIKGAIGGIVTCLRCDIAYNGMAGWDFDDGSGSHNGFGTASVNGVWNFKYSKIEWSGCNQEYPMKDAIPVISCYGQSNGGYGDGVGTPPGMCLTVNIDHSAFNYNTQDGLDLGHIDAGTCTATITNSVAIGNSGQTFKWGPNESTVVFENNLAMANCLRLSEPMPGAPTTYNANLGDFCRAGDAMSFNFRQGGTALLANNTIVTYQPTTFDTQCWDAPGTGGSNTGCGNSTLTLKDNIVLAYDNPMTYPYGGQVGGPGLFYFRDLIGNVVRSNNIFFGVGHGACSNLSTAEHCEDPLLVNEPAWTTDSALDNFNFDITTGSPAKGSGVAIPSLTLDYTGQARGNPPSIGAYE